MSFLSKVFGRKKDDKPGSPRAHPNKRHSNASLLEGRYEAVSPSISPSADKFAERAQQAKDKDGAPSNPLSLFRSRSRNLTDPTRSSSTPSLPTPHLTLNLPVPKEEKSRALGVVFEADPDNISTLPEIVLGERRLNPLETLLLVKACSDHIAQHGALETLGLMHPHWYAASPEVQRKLVSLFIISLESKMRSPVTTLSPIPTSPSTLFSTELEYTRSPHDVAAVLRWAIRHVRLEGSAFGSKGQGEWGWYVDFATRERQGGYPPNAFSQILVPQLPPAHLQLLTATLDTIASLAAHAETTGASGSKLAKLFGLWLLAQPRNKAAENWQEFYTRWEQAGRILEHLFLAHVREDTLANRLPLRLAELVKKYPYSTHPDSEGGLPLLPRSPFSTRIEEALFVHIDTKLPSPNSKPPSRDHPLRLISEALKAVAASDASIPEGPSSAWENIKKAAAEATESGDAYPILTKVLDDETLRLLSLVPAEVSDDSTTPTSASTVSTATPILRTPIPRRRSSSVGATTGKGNGKASANGHTRDSTAPASFTNWGDFSVVGFGDSLLTNDFVATLDTDVEVTSPPTPLAPASKKRVVLPSARSRASTVDAVTLQAAEKRGREGAPEETSRKASLKRVDVVSVDEAFVDFWSDALRDPVTAAWPSFVVCQLRPGAWPMGLLIIEHSYTAPAPPAPPPVPAVPPMPERRAASPRPSLSSNVSARKSFTFSPTRKRFSLFSSHNESSTKTAPRRGSKTSVARSSRIGEMGEVLPEDVPLPTTPPVPAMPIRERDSSLPPIPVVSISPIDATAPAHVEPVKTDDTPKEKPTVDLSKDVSVPTDASTSAEKALPPAPEPVVLTGGTPSPQVALTSSEPAAIVQASTSASADAEAAADSQAKAEDHLGQSGLPEISNLSELAASAPVDPPPESPVRADAAADSAPPAPPTSSGSRLIESFSEGGAEHGSYTSTSHAAEHASEQEAATTEPTNAQASVPAQASNSGDATEPSPSNSDDTVVGSDPGPVDDAEPSSPPEASIDQISDTHAEHISSAPAASHSGNGAISQEPDMPDATTANPDDEVKAEASTSPNADNHQTNSS